MNTLRPERSFEDLLASLERDLLDASDEEILAVANELGIKPEMKGSIALFGVAVAVRFKDPRKSPRRQSRSESSATRARSRRGPKGDASSST